jgi:hypothetical protein
MLLRPSVWLIGAVCERGTPTRIYELPSRLGGGGRRSPVRRVTEGVQAGADGEHGGGGQRGRGREPWRMRWSTSGAPHGAGESSSTSSPTSAIPSCGPRCRRRRGGCRSRSGRRTGLVDDGTGGGGQGGQVRAVRGGNRPDPVQARAGHSWPRGTPTAARKGAIDDFRSGRRKAVRRRTAA